MLMLMPLQLRQRTSLRYLLYDEHIATPSEGNFSSQHKLSEGIYCLSEVQASFLFATHSYDLFRLLFRLLFVILLGITLNFLFAKFIWFFMSTRFGVFVVHSANSLLYWKLS